MLGKDDIVRVRVDAIDAYKLPTVTAVGGCNTYHFGTQPTLHFLWLLDFLKGISDVKEIMNVKGGLQVSYSEWRMEEGGSSTGGAAHIGSSLLVLDDQLLQTLLAVDMEALEQFGVFEGVEADGTG